MSPASDAAERAAEHFEMRVGLRLCARLATATKAFCGCAQAPAGQPNADVCALCLGLPGALPALNARAVELATRAALALGCTINPVTTFARAHGRPAAYLRGYALVQHPRPLGVGGRVEIGVSPSGAPITVPVDRVALSESGADTSGADVDGASDNGGAEEGLDASFAGAALLEIDVAPELWSPEEAAALVRQVQATLRHVGASRASFVQGTLTVAATLGARPRGDTAAPALCEIVALGSMPALAGALRAGFARQVERLAAKSESAPARLAWDASSNALRPLPDTADRRWLADPDLPPLILTASWIDDRREGLPDPPSVRRAHLADDLALTDAQVHALAADPSLGDYYAAVARATDDPAAAARWVLEDVVPLLDPEDPDVEAFALRVRPGDLAQLVTLVRDVRLTEAAARQTLQRMARTGEGPERAARGEELLS